MPGGNQQGIGNLERLDDIVARPHWSPGSIRDGDNRFSAANVIHENQILSRPIPIYLGLVRIAVPFIANLAVFQSAQVEEADRRQTGFNFNINWLTVIVEIVGFCRAR